MATLTPDLAALQAQILTEFPKFKTVSKGDVWFMKALGLVFGQSFMTSFLTTINNTVYLPTSWAQWAPAEQCALLRHERVHMRQARALTFPVFGLLYLLVFFPVGLAYFRAKFEEEAYAESLAAYKDYGYDYSSATQKAWLVSMFTGGSYGWMWPFAGSVGAWFDATVAKLNA